MSDIRKDDKSGRNVPYWMTGPQSTGNYFLDLLLLAGGLVGVFLALMGLLYGAVLTIGGIAVLVDGLGSGFGAQLSRHLPMGMLTGAFAGVATVAYRAYRKNPSNAEMSFLSALFTKDGLSRFEFDAVFWGRVAVGGAVGLLVGLLASTSGALSPLEWLAGPPSDFAGTPLGQITAGVVGGGGWGDFLASLFLCALGLVVLGLLVGLAFGCGIQLLLFVAAGAAKGATKEYILLILEEARSRDEIFTPKPIASGAVRGAIVGTIVGVLFTLSTALR